MQTIKSKIPKLIHYCWFGGNPMTEMEKKCIESWKKYCPEYQIMEWSEENFDLNYNDYVREAYQEKKWAFVSDVVRLYALVNYGGIYMDTDVEVIKPLDGLLGYEAVSGFESDTQISTGFMACKKNQIMFKKFLDDYDSRHFILNDGSLDLTTNVTYITNTCLKYGLIQNNTLQCINGFALLPRDYLSPKDYETGEIHITKNTYMIHHFNASWHSYEERYINKLRIRLKKIPGGNQIAKFIGISKFKGINAALKALNEWAYKKGKKL